MVRMPPLVHCRIPPPAPQALLPLTVERSTCRMAVLPETAMPPPHPLEKVAELPLIVLATIEPEPLTN